MVLNQGTGDIRVKIITGLFGKGNDWTNDKLRDFLKEFSNIEPKTSEDLCTEKSLYEKEKILRSNIRGLVKSTIKEMERYGMGLTYPNSVIKEYNKFLDCIMGFIISDKVLQTMVNNFTQNHLVKFINDYENPDKYINKVRSIKYENPILRVRNELDKIRIYIEVKLDVINGCLSLMRRDKKSITIRDINHLQELTLPELQELSKELFWR